MLHCDSHEWDQAIYKLQLKECYIFFQIFCPSYHPFITINRNWWRPAVHIGHRSPSPRPIVRSLNSLTVMCLYGIRELTLLIWEYSEKFQSFYFTLIERLDQWDVFSTYSIVEYKYFTIKACCLILM